jgi:phosphotransferase system HPr-like phosphotransfer protein
MKDMYIKLNSITDVTDLVKMASKVEGDVTCNKGRYCVDVKSIMGMFSIDLSTGATIEYPDSAIEFEKYLNNFKASL